MPLVRAVPFSRSHAVLYIVPFHSVTLLMETERRFGTERHGLRDRVRGGVSVREVLGPGLGNSVGNTIPSKNCLRCARGQGPNNISSKIAIISFFQNFLTFFWIC